MATYGMNGFANPNYAQALQGWMSPNNPGALANFSPDAALPGAIDPNSLGSLSSVSARAPTLGESLSSWFNDSGILGKRNADGSQTQGWGSLGIGVASGLLNGYLGLQQLGIAKDTLANNKAQFAQNFAAQQKTTNAALADRQAARVASNPGAYQSVGDYMKKYGI